MGRFFGDAAEKPGNIAAFAMVAGLLGIVCIALWMPESAAHKGQLLTLFGTVVTGAIGFAFGRSTN